MLKKIVSIVIAMILVLVCVTSLSESVSIKDATYEYLFANLLNVMSTNEQENFLKLQNATVWKVNGSLAGFMFEGDNWSITGEAMIDTGLIYKINARLPYNIAGILATRLIAYTLSEEADWDVFTEKYTNDDVILAETPMAHYANTLNSGNSTTMIYEFTRTINLDLNNNANLFDMKNTIMTMQSFN